MKQLCYTISLLLFCSTALCQTNDSFGKIDFGFQGIGLGYEAALGNHFLIASSAGIGGGLYSRDHAGYTFALADPTFFASGEAKYLLNREKRIERGKLTSYNSSNYLAYQIKFTANNKDQINNSEALLNELHWGLQRRLGEESKFLFTMHLGLGYLHDFTYDDARVIPTIGGKFAFVIF